MSLNSSIYNYQNNTILTIKMQKLTTAKSYLINLAINNKQFEKFNQTFSETKNKLVKSIKQGIVKVNDNSSELNLKIQDLDQIVKNKKTQLQLQLDTFVDEEAINSQKYKILKRQLLQIKRQQAEALKAQEEKRKKQVQQKTKKWIEEQRAIELRKEITEQKKKQLQKQKQQKIRQQEEEMKNFHKLQKKKLIERKLREIQDQKQQRQTIIKKGLEMLNSKSLPKYIEIQKKYQQQQFQKKFQQEIAAKNRKIQSHIDSEAIKIHQKQYLEKVKARVKSQEKLRPPNKQQRAQFSILFTRNEDEITQQLEKLKRRRMFQQKLEKIPIEIDEAKRVQVQIAKDRGENPVKYNFLSQKALNQFQIYGQFKQFSININPRQLGNQYLQELKTLPKISRVTKSVSLQSLSQAQKQKDKPYMNYLIQLKQSRPRKIQNGQNVQQIIKNCKDKNQAKGIIMKQSQLYEADAIKKIDELKNAKGYKQSLKKSSQADESLMKAVKTKLAYLQMQS